MRRKAVPVLILLLIAGGLAYAWLRPGPSVLMLTGIVSTDDVIVSAQVPGQISTLAVTAGQQVARGDVIATIAPAELQADTRYYEELSAGASSVIAQNQAALRFQQQQSTAAVDQARATLAAAEAAEASAAAELENARLLLGRTQTLQKNGVASTEQLDQARTSFTAVEARVRSLARQTEAARAAVAMAEANAEQTAMHQKQVEASRAQHAAADAQRERAAVRLGYAEVRAPMNGLVDVRAARQGEVVSAGQPIVTLINPDDLWVRVDVEETYIDRVKLGDHLTIRLPSGAQIDGVVFDRAVDAGFATQRDVSRTKRDIKTFAIRLRVDNTDRRLAVGMTASVLLPVR
jgi:multidrug resistance efflux pump